MKTSSESVKQLPSELPAPPNIPPELRPVHVQPHSAAVRANLNLTSHFVPVGIRHVDLQGPKVKVVRGAGPGRAVDPSPKQTNPVSLDVTTAAMRAQSRTKTVRPEQPPRRSFFASTGFVLVVSFAALVGRYLLLGGWSGVLVCLSPLLLLLTRAQRARWSWYAGVLWLAISWLAVSRPFPVHALPWQGQLSLGVLAVILLSVRHAYRGMEALSYTDPLTGLLNRRGFDEIGGAELRRAARYGRPMAFALLDLDRFKDINDQYGHAVGDRVLQEVGAQLKRLRHSDVAVRLGGDEFGVLMPETDRAGAEMLLSRLSQRVHEATARHGWPVTVSVGIAERMPQWTRMDSLIAEADRRMYEAKLTVHTHPAAP
jgi:diguanylate cyclase (GGDEF)-like protein